MNLIKLDIEQPHNETPVEVLSEMIVNANDYTGCIVLLMGGDDDGVIMRHTNNISFAEAGFQLFSAAVGVASHTTD